MRGFQGSGRLVRKHAQCATNRYTIPRTVSMRSGPRLRRRYRMYTSTTFDPGSKSSPQMRDSNCSRDNTWSGCRKKVSASANSRAFAAGGRT